MGLAARRWASAVAPCAWGLYARPPAASGSARRGTGGGGVAGLLPAGRPPADAAEAAAELRAAAEAVDVQSESTGCSAHAKLVPVLHGLLAEGSAEAERFEAAVLGLSALDRALHDAAGDGNRVLLMERLRPGGSLADVLGLEATAWLERLLGAACVNARNLTLHGFVAAAEAPRCWGVLAARLLAELPPPAQNRQPLASGVRSAEEGRWSPLAVCARETARGESLARTSPFVPDVHRAALSLAWRRLEDHRPNRFCALALPALEHALRVLHAAANGLGPDAELARMGAYYVTLDGHGQRNVHDLLLGPTSGDAPNRLLDELCPGVVAALTDLFLRDAGPGLRGRVVHGEVDLDAAGPPDAATELLAASLLALCGDEEFVAAMSGYVPRFSPRARRLAAAGALRDAVSELASLRQRYSLAPSGVLTNRETGAELATLDTRVGAEPLAAPARLQEAVEALSSAARANAPSDEAVDEMLRAAADEVARGAREAVGRVEALVELAATRKARTNHRKSLVGALMSQEAVASATTLFGLLADGTTRDVPAGVAKKALAAASGFRAGCTDGEFRNAVSRVETFAGSKAFVAWLDG